MSTLNPDPNRVPALEPPKGHTSNLVDPPSQADAIISSLVLYMLIATPCVIARIYTRAKIHKKLWWDDWTSVLALIGLYGVCSIPLLSLQYGLGTDKWNVSRAHAHLFKELFSDIEIVARISIFFTKLSVLLLYLRYFCPAGTYRTWIFYSSWFVIIFNLLYCVALVLVVLLQCAGKPATVKEAGTCIDDYLVLVTASIINVLSDLAMLVIPLMAVWNLCLPRKRKLGLLVVFAVGGLACAASIARLAYQVPEASNPNQTVVLANVTLLALAEHTIGIVVGCMPLFPALYRHFRRPKSPVNVLSTVPVGSSRWKRAFPSSARKHQSLGSETDLRWAEQGYRLEALEEGEAEIAP